MVGFTSSYWMEQIRSARVWLLRCCDLRCCGLVMVEDGGDLGRSLTRLRRDGIKTRDVEARGKLKGEDGLEIRLCSFCQD